MERLYDFSLDGKELGLLSMKMVILEIAGNYAAALSDDGTISRIPNQNYQVGQTLRCPDRKKQNCFTVYARRIAAVAAVFVFMLIGAGVLTRIPVTFVSLDVNPSVEYKLNVFDQVVDVVMVNEDARTLLENTALVNQPADQAIRKTVELLGENNYLKTEQKNDIVISATGSVARKSKAVLHSVAKATKEATESMDISAGIVVIESSMSDLKQAEKLGTTPGKMLLVNEIVETDVPTMDLQAEEAGEVQTLLQMPVAELVSVLSQDGLSQLSQMNDSISYIQADNSGIESSNPVFDTAPADNEPPAPADSAGSTTASESQSTSAPAVSDSTSQPGSETTGSSEASQAEPMNPGEIPPVTPGQTTSSTSDEDAASKPENSLGPVTPPDSSEIPSIKPGIGASETTDEETSSQPENSPDETTSAPEESDVNTETASDSDSEVEEIR